MVPSTFMCVLLFSLVLADTMTSVMEIDRGLLNIRLWHLDASKIVTFQFWNVD